MKKYRWMIVVMVIGILIAFAGCGGSSESGDSAEAVSIESSELAFETEDIEGAAATSEEVFSDHAVTMVNFWGTFCGPCIQEMPELEKLNGEFQKAGGAIVGVVVDVPEGEDDLLGDAKDIVKETGVKYRNLRAWDGLSEALLITAVPTTVFVDRTGKIIGEPVVGADIEGYRSQMEKLLAEAK